jgi:ParB family transcriptional regulator, chromosome partitioning protein
LRKINCHLIELSDQEAYELALTENVQHNTMNAIDEAVAFNRYVKEYGWGGVSYLALRIGRSQEYVIKQIQLLSLPNNIISDIIDRRISPTTALELLPLNNTQTLGLAKIINSSNLSKNHMRQIVKNYKNIKNHNGTACYDIVSQEAMDRAFRKAIIVLKSTLISWDDIIRNLNDDWLLREIFMEYRITLHSDIDTFLGLRKRMKKCNNLRTESSQPLVRRQKEHEEIKEPSNSTMHTLRRTY